MIQLVKKFIATATLFIFALFTSSAQEDYTKYIDPTIGNVARFLVPTYPTMHLPNQMLRMFPVKKDYLSDQVSAFPLQVVSHRSAGILQMKVALGEITETSWKQKMNIDHDLEVVHPWFYSTYLIDDDIRVSFAPGEKCAIYKIDFPSGKKKNILIQGSREMKSTVNDKASFTFGEKINYKTRGINSVTRTMSAFVYGTVTDLENKLVEGASINAGNRKFSISFSKDSPSTVLLKYAVSYISFEQAKRNFEKELRNTGFKELAASGKKDWEKVINQIEVKGGTKAQKRTFYTALYRTCERMVDINEYGKYYSGYDGKVHESNRPFYVDDWIWDTYRADHPLRTILAPEKENDMLNSYILMYEQSGWMPTFPELHGNHMCMNSYHSSAIFIDGYRKGLRNYDVEKAYEGIRKNLMEGTFIPWRQGTPRRPIDDFYHKNGYFPALHPGEKETEPQMDGFEKRQPIPVTLGISYDFWALSELAKELGKTEDYKKFAPQGKDYQNLWHPEQRLFMPKDDKGKWIDIDPKSAGGRGYREFYDENNGWTYAWDVQQDIEGLTKLLGGKKAAEQRLDQLFREPLGMKKNLFFVNGSNSTGLVGQFSMGNEPSFHIPYLYNYFGAPWKTQKRTRFLLDVWFKDNIFGIPGDEDGGGMSAFVVFTSMGLYPVTPGLPFYNITSPVFEKTTINLTNGKKFTVLAKGASRTKKYIQKAFINGEEIASPFVTHKQIMAGGTLELILDELPNKEWGKDAKIPTLF
ncbi:MAG: GH92 family glycosyl hydrolase [Prolixibacteraceae bacterium]|nr:GH92 family glycosyl hydrolase [Prolixibacteraceae bacterium]